VLQSLDRKMQKAAGGLRLRPLRRAAADEISGLNWKWVKLIKCPPRLASPRDLASLGLLRLLRLSQHDDVISSESGGVVSATRRPTVI